MAIVLMRKTGFAWSSNPYGITDPKGNPCCLRESVERLPTRFRYTKVRARSANVGSAIADRLLAAPEPACFPAVDEDILCSHMDSTHDQGPSCCQDPWNKLTRCGLRRPFKAQREFGRAEKKERGARCTSQAPPLLRQRKQYLTGSPPSRQERRCRQECRVIRL